jgi:hypothetical protein
MDDEVRCYVISIYSEKLGYFIVNRVMVGNSDDALRYAKQIRKVFGEHTRVSIEPHRLHKADSKAGKVNVYMKGETL